MNSAHRFTHVRQIKDSNNSFEFLKRVSRGNSYDATKVFMMVGEKLFKGFDTEVKSMAVFDTFNNP